MRSRATGALMAAVAVLSAATIADAGVAQAGQGWGAIAYSHNGTNATAWDYPSAADAGQAAVSTCGYTDCEVLTQFPECGAVVKDSNYFQGGHGPTLRAAIASALAQLPSHVGYVDAWACNST